MILLDLLIQDSGKRNSGERHLQEDLFLKILELNEQIKTIDRYAYAIRLRAINALILSARIGEKAAAFGVVTADLIQFSENCRIRVEELNRLTLDIVQFTTGLVKTANTERLINKSVKSLRFLLKGDRENETLGIGTAFLEQSQEIFVQGQKEQIRPIIERVEAMMPVVTTSIKLCMSARVALLRGQIEVAHMREQIFGLVLLEIEDAIEVMEKILKKITSEWK